MSNRAGNKQFTLEIFLVVIVIALTCLLSRTVGYKMIVLNLFYLPIVLAGFFLGRYRAGVLTLFSVISASVVMAFDLSQFGQTMPPVIIGLAVTVWGAVLGLTSILVGTLSDDRTTKIEELHEAYVGVVEVLSRYLQSANPRLKARSSRVAELCHRVARQMKLSPREVDDIRVAALMHDMENIEITARVIRKAMGEIETEQSKGGQHTFHGTDLVHSLGSVLNGAFPLLLDQSYSMQHGSFSEDAPQASEKPVGAKIIRTVRAYDALVEDEWGPQQASDDDVIEELRRDAEADHDPAVLDALRRTLANKKDHHPEESFLVEV